MDSSNSMPDRLVSRHVEEKPLYDQLASRISDEAVERAARVMAETYWAGSADGKAATLPVDPAWLAAMRAALEAAR